MKNLARGLFLVLILSFAFQIHAQSDGTAPSDAGTTMPADPNSTTNPADPTSSTSGVPASSTTRAPASTSASPASVKPKISTSNPAPTPISAPLASEEVSPVSTNSTTENNSNTSTIIIIAGALGLGILGGVIMKVKKKKPLAAQNNNKKKDDKKCFNLKKMMQDKLDELTDLEGQLKNKVQDKLISEALAHLPEQIETAKKAYDKIKELYEKCITDISLPKTTLLYLYKRKEGQILLAMKKRGLGEGKWNGVGGKLEDGETIEEGIIREAQEEIGVRVKKNDLKKVAVLDFHFEDNASLNQQTHAFFVENWEGDPVETEEMSPKWHSIDELPLNKMWIDDPHWLPRALKGEKLTASFHFDKSGKSILGKKIENMV